MRNLWTRRDLFKVGAGAYALAAGSRTLLAGVDPKLEFNFIQLTDTHLSTKRLYSKRRGYDIPSEQSIRRTNEVVKAINTCTMPTDLIVHTGDLTETREPIDDYNLARELLDFPGKHCFLPGNHDVGYSRTEDYVPAFEKRFGKVDTAFSPTNGLRMVLFNSQPLDPRAPEASRNAALERLEKLLTPAEPTILCCHCTGLDSFYNNNLYPGWPQETMDRWTALLNQGGVMTVLGGHFHIDRYELVDSIPFHIAGPVIHFWGRQTCFRHWRLANGELRYRTVYLDL